MFSYVPRLLRHAFLVIGALFLLSACTSMSAEECAVADWEQVGYSDAAAGRDSTRLENHRRACADAGVTPDMQRYLDGYDQGLSTYCSAQTGFSHGSSGLAKPSQCDDEYRFDSFRDGYEKGQLRYTLSRRANAVAEDLAQADQIISDLTDHITSLTDEINNAPLSDDERAKKERQRNSFRSLLAEEELDRQAIKDELQDLQDRAAAISP